MKKIILFAIGLLTSVTTLADDYEFGGLTYDCDKTTHKATLKSGPTILISPLVIPPSFKMDGDDEEYKVTSIGDGAFTKATQNINDVVIPEGVTSIGKDAFKGCNQLKKIVLPSTLGDDIEGSIGANAFSGCSQLVYIVWGVEEPEKYGPTIFPDNNLMTLYVHEDKKEKYLNSQWKSTTIKKFGDRIYGGQIEKVIHDGMEYLCATGTEGEAILITGNATSTFTVPSSFEEKGKIYHVKGIEKSAFTNSADLSILTIEDGVTYINDNACQNCSKLKRLELPSTLRFIGSNAFYGCNDLIHIYCRVEDPNNLDPTNLPGNVIDNNGGYNMVTLYAPTKESQLAYKDHEKWSGRFKDRIYGGNMLIIENGGMVYVCAEHTHEATLYSGKDDIKTIEGSFKENNVPYIVTGIDKEAFINCKNITNLIIKDNITAIGPNAFLNCSNIEVITLPNSLERVGSNVFNGCSNLVRVESNIQNPISIPSNLFTNANSNEKILYVPQYSLKFYENSNGWKNGFTYSMEGSMNDVVFKYKDDHGTYVCDMTFASATYSSDAVLIKVSDNEAKKIEIPASFDGYNVVGVFKDAFKPSPSKTTMLEELSFKEGNHNLTIGKGGLNYCSKLRILKLPTQLNKLGSGAFTACSNLEHILFKSNASIIVENVFGEKTRNSAILYVPSGSSETDFVNIGWNPNNIIKAEYLEEFNDKNNGMTYVGWRQESAETGTAKLIKGKPGTSDEEFSILSSAISDKDVNYDVIAIADNAFSSVGTAFKNLTISEGILQIGMSAFQGRSSINRVKLPSSLTKIGEKAFYGCGNLTDIEAISKDVSLNVSEIGASAFYNCTSLEKITLPASLTSIGLSAFAGCSKLKEIESKIKPTIYNPLFEIDNTVFPNYSATLYVPSGTKDAYLATNSWQEFGDNIRVGSREVYEDNGLKYAYASEETTAILIRSNPTEKSVKILSEIPNSNAVVTSILESAFENNTSIESVFIPGKVTSIGSKAFNKCSNLKTVQFGNDETPSNLSSIGVQAFANCRNLKKIISTIPSNKLCDISNVFTYDDAQFAMSPEVIYIPVEDDSKYTTIWNIGLFAGKFVVGYPGYDGEAEGENGGIGWYYDYLTIDNKDIENTKNTATLKRASTRIEENGDLLVPGWVTIKGKLYKVTGIDKQAFNDYDGKSSVNKLRIDDNIVNIGASAFSALSNLKQVWFPKTLNEIGANAFNVNNIKYVCCEASTHPNSVSAIFSESKDVYLFVPSVEAKDDYVQETIWTNNTKAKVRVGYFVDEIPLTNTVYEKMEFVCLKDKKDGVKKTAILNKSVTTKEDVEIPSSVILQQEPYVVTAIAESAFSGSSKLKLIRIPQNIKEIGDKAFDGCTMLTEIESQILPTDENPLFEIENTVFSNYSATLYVPTVEAKAKYMTTNGWKQFGDNISAGSRDVYSYEGLNYVYATYGETATLIKSNPTEKAVKILDKIPNSNAVVTSILESAFENNTSIESVFIPGEVTSIGSKAFNKCSNLKTIQFGDDETTSELASIGEKSFANCRNLKTIISTIPSNKLCDISNVFTYDDAQFAMSPDVIYIPVEDDSKYTTIWNIGLFAGKFVSGYPGYDGVGEKGWLYDYLTVDDLDIDKTKNTATLKKAKQSAADENHVLTIPSKVTIKERKYKVTKIGDNAFNEYAGKNSDEGLKIQKTITEIGKNAFYGFSKLKIVKLPKSLKSIGSMAFSGCGSITHVCSEMESPIMGDDVFSTPTTTATFFVPTLEGYNKNILDKFPNVVVGKFDGDKQEGELIYSCYTDADEHKAIVTKSGTGVVEATIKESVKTSEDGDDYTVTTIGKNAFNGCTKLKKIELPSKLASIGNVPPVGENAFEECVILDEIVSDIKGDDLKPIPTNVFSEYTRNNAKVYVPDEDSKAIYQATEGWDVFKSNAPDNYIVGKWIESDVQNDYMKYKCHTGTGDAIVIGIDFPDDDKIKDLIINRNVTITIEGVGEKTYHVISIAPTEIKNKGKIQTISIVDNATEENDATESKTIAIANDAFKGCVNLKRVEFPSYLTEIGDNAFQGCSNLQKISFPSSLTKIGSKAFNGCNNLTRVCIEAIPTLGNTDAFSTYNKTLLFVPTGALSTIDGEAGWRAFSRKYEGYYEDESPEGVDRAYIYLKQTGNKRTAILTKSLTSDPIDRTVEYGGTTYSVTIIGESAFSSASLVDLDLPETITIIEKKAFQNQRSLKTLNLSSNLKLIDDDAFQNCNSLQKVVLPASLKIIGNRTFSDNTNLMDLTFSEGTIIESIGNDAFKNCTNLKSIVLPSTLTKISSTAFDGCSNLTEVISKITNETVVTDTNNTPSAPNAILYVPDGTVDLYEGWKSNFLYVLEGNQNLGNYEGLKYAYTNKDKKAILIGVDQEKGIKDGSVTIPSVVTLGDNHVECEVIAIDKDAFKDIKATVRIVTIGEKIKTIAEGAFDGCSNLAEIICKDYYKNINTLSQSDVILYVPDDDKKTDYVNAGWKSEHIYIGERQTRPDGGLLYAYATGGDEATLIGVTEGGIDNDGVVTIPDAIKFKINDNDADKKEFKVVAIANSVFRDNTDVKLVSIGENIRSIGANVFTGCTNLKEFVSKINDPSVVSNISLSIPGAILYVPSNDEDLVTAYNGWNSSYTLVGERETAHENGLYYVCATVDKKAILIEGKIKEMKENVVIPGSISGYDVIAIYDNAFSGNSNIKTLKVEEKLNTIGASAFQNCIALNKIWLPESLDGIADNAFNGCTDIDYLCTKRKTPLAAPCISKNAFPKFKSTSTLYIPYGSKEAYSNDTELGGKFSIIKEGTFEGDVSKSGLTYECIINDKNEKVAMVAKAAATVTDSEILNEVQIDIDETKFAVTTIYKDAFKDCKNLKTMIFPLTLRTIEDKAFEHCTKLITITSRIKKDDLNSFNENVFPEDVYKNAIVYIPNDAETETKYKATKGWEKFNNWAKGEKKTGTIGSMTYEYLVGVGTATLTGTTVDKEDVTIDGTVEIGGVTYTVTAIAESAFKNNSNRGKMTKLKIAKNITTIGAYAFQGCSNLKMVWLPTSITSIGEKAFDGCNGITHVSSSIESPAENEANYFPDNATLYVPKGGKEKYNVSGWNNVSYVAEGDFVDVCTEDNVTYDCLTIDDIKKAILRKYLASSNDVVIPDSVKLGEDYYTVAIIAKSAFANKTSITSLSIPSGVEGIDADVFSGCSKLTWIESKIESPIDITGKNVFAKNTATLFIPSDKVADYRAKGWDFLNIYVGDRKETTIEGWTYVYSTGDKKAILTKVNNVGKDVTIDGTFKIGKDEYTVTAIAEAVFKGKTNIEGLTISENIENIGATAFQGCEKIEKVELPSTLETIGDKAFDGCSHLVSVTCNGATPATVGADAFPSYNLTLNVPSDAVETYKKDATWGQFTTILGIVTSISDEDADENTADYVDTTPSEDGANPTVTLVDGSDVHDAFAIPETVLINNVAHFVTVIGANAFKDNINLKEVTISKYVTAIRESAFAGCKNLASITVDIVVPLDLSAPATTRGNITRSGGSSIFEGVDKKTCILYVPSGSVDAYKAAPVWGDFENILPIGTTAINGVIVSDNDKPFDVYNMQGRKVKENTTTLKGLPSGIYIVNGKKLMVK